MSESFTMFDSWTATKHFLKLFKSHVMKIEELKTQVKKSFHGWQAQTIRTEKGQTFDICTMKRYSGKLTTSVTKVDAQNDGVFLCISHGMNDTFLNVDHGKIKATENTVRKAHFEALAIFDEKIQTVSEVEIKPVLPEVGDVLFLGGYGKDKGYRENNHIIYKIEKSNYGMKYYCIEKDTLELSIKDYVSDYTKRKGQTIGMYFLKGYNVDTFKIDSDTLANMLIDAQGVKKRAEEQREKEQAEAKRKAEERRVYLSQFIQADRRKTTNIIKAHCLKSWPIAKIEVSTDSFSGGDSMDVTYYAPDEIKELESFIENFQYGHFNGMEDIYEYSDREDIIIDGHILQQYKYVHCKFKLMDLPEVKEPVKNEGSEWWVDELLQPESDIQIIDYSEKAIAVIGEGTKRIKDQLKALGGRFNFKLSCGAGWIFPISKRDQILAII